MASFCHPASESLKCNILFRLFFSKCHGFHESLIKYQIHEMQHKTYPEILTLPALRKLFSLIQKCKRFLRMQKMHH